MRDGALRLLSSKLSRGGKDCRGSGHRYRQRREKRHMRNGEKISRKQSAYHQRKAYEPRIRRRLLGSGHGQNQGLYKGGGRLRQVLLVLYNPICARTGSLTKARGYFKAGAALRRERSQGDSAYGDKSRLLRTGNGAYARRRGKSGGGCGCGADKTKLSRTRNDN